MNENSSELPADQDLPNLILLQMYARERGQRLSPALDALYQAKLQVENVRLMIAQTKEILIDTIAKAEQLTHKQRLGGIDGNVIRLTDESCTAEARVMLDIVQEFEDKPTLDKAHELFRAVCILRDKVTQLMLKSAECPATSPDQTTS